MASKIRKDFAGNLALGRKRDHELRATSDEVDTRFDQVEAALAGRPSLLAPPAPSSPESNAQEAGTFYIESLLKEGRVTKRFAKIPLTNITDNPLNSRKFYDDEKVKARAASMAADGQLVPAVAAPNPDLADHYILIDGHYRKRANLLLSQPTLDCMVLDGLTKVDFYKLARTLNNEREQESILDIAFSYRQLLDAGIARTEEDLIPIVGESKAKINKMLALTGLPQAVLDVIVQTPDAFGYNIGYELTLYNKVAGAEKTVELAERIAEERLPFSKVEAIRKKAEEGTKTKRNTSRQYTLKRSGVVIGTLKEWDNGRVTLDMTFDDPVKREAYVASVKNQLDVDDEPAPTA
ncbi:Chromosome partitioning protein ParB [Cupriavidus taiwanensis]|uniref:ParB/RepB/Spo0J family partition protein n=1 Tax=Cupriavidus taiwanensis TaxID=164546 RepID=UPI000E193659|nr:ParB/RepB/Spo0J family partition protein [Cupriavidus taiwanensis]SPA23662.1 Chromosome partitioning protein ParB [Cupriavidus taiwanensis]